MMQHGTPDEWSCIAMSTASQLPQDEAFDILRRALHTVEIGHIAANLGQAISITKHPEAEATLREHLQDVWVSGALWDDDSFVNGVAFDATTSIAHLLELGASPADFEAQVRQLSEHACAGNRDSCRRYLSKHYTWRLITLQ
jgi:aspartate oxidase